MVTGFVNPLVYPTLGLARVILVVDASRAHLGDESATGWGKRRLEIFKML
jgi:hypothetical protein